MRARMGPSKKEGAKKCINHFAEVVGGEMLMTN